MAVAAPPVAAGRRRAAPRARVVAGTALFVLGFSVVFVAYGAALGGLGHLLTGHARLLTRILGGLTILLGLLFAGVFDRFSFAGRIVRPSARPKAGLAGAPLLGVMFGLGWTPCIGPTLTAVLALSASSGTAARGALLAFVYALGLGIPFLFVSFGFQARDAGVRLRPAPRPPGHQDRRGHAGLRRPARGNRRLVHLHGLAPGPLGQQLPAPAVAARRRGQERAACRFADRFERAVTSAAGRRGGRGLGRRHQGLEHPGVVAVLRMPLHADAEPVSLQLDRLHHLVRVHATVRSPLPIRSIAW